MQTATESRPVSFGQYLSDNWTQRRAGAAAWVSWWQNDVAGELLELLDDDGQVKAGTPPGIAKLVEQLRDTVLMAAERDGVEIKR